MTIGRRRVRITSDKVTLVTQVHKNLEMQHSAEGPEISSSEECLSVVDLWEKPYRE